MRLQFKAINCAFTKQKSEWIEIKMRNYNQNKIFTLAI